MDNGRLHPVWWMSVARSALQLLVPRDMPFGVTGPSPVVSAVQTKVELDLIQYSTEAELIWAAERGDIYGGYIPGESSDTIVTVPAKSFLGFSVVIALITAAAARLTGAIPWSHVWTLLPCFALVTVAVALPGVQSNISSGRWAPC